jgi:hypothetical protein
MEFVIGLLGVLAAVIIPVYLHRKNHPRRELRYAVVPVGERRWRLMLWSTGRADIPSASFDAGRSIVFKFSSPVLVDERSEDVARGFYSDAGPATELHFPARLLHRDFADEVFLTANAPFDVRVDHPLIDIPFVNDRKVEQAAAPSKQAQVVRRSRARANVSLLMVSLWLTGASFALFVLGLALSFADADLGAGLGIPGMLLLPVGIIMIAIAVIRRLVARRKRRQAPRLL